jgi:hypothetical protein
VTFSSLVDELEEELKLLADLFPDMLAEIQKAILAK